MKRKIPYINLFGAALVLTIVPFISIDIFVNDVGLGVIGFLISGVITFGFVSLNNYLIVRNLNT